MADHAKPILTDNYTDVLSQIRGRFEDQAKGFDPASTTATNISTGTIRWNSAEKKFQKWSGTAWGDLTDNYVLSGATFSAGTPNGVAYLNGSKVLTTGSALTFDGANFGIGTNTPIARLDVQAPANGLLANFMENTSGATRRIRFSNNGTTNTIESTTGTGSTNLAFAVDGTEQMRLTSTGLGIGTSSPSEKLDVSTAAGSVFIRFRNSSASSGYVGYNGDALTFLTNTTERMRLDANGNLGIGAVPSAWVSVGRAIEIGDAGTGIWGRPLISDYVTNTYFSATGYRYALNGAAARYTVNGGEHSWFTAPSGTAGTTISFTQAMTLDANGNLGIGTSSPDAVLTLNKSSGAADIRLKVNNVLYGNMYASASDFTINSLTAIPLTFGTNNTERMRIDSNGKLILSAANQGIQFADGTTQTTAATAPTTSNVLSATAGAVAGGVGTYAMLRWNGTGVVFAGEVISSNSSILNYASAGGPTGLGYIPDGQSWMCMGTASSSSDPSFRTTLWLRVS